MQRDLLERHATLRLLVTLLTIIAVMYAGGMIWSVVAHYQSVILLLFLAWIVAFVLQPLVAILERFHIRRLLAVALIYLALVALAVGSILLALPTIRAEASRLAPELANLFSTGNISALASRAAGLLQLLGFSARDAQSLVDQVVKEIPPAMGNLSNQAVTIAESLFGQVASLIFNAVLVAIMSFYMMLDGDRLIESLVKRLPPAWIPDVRLFQRHVDVIFGGFMRAALIISAVYALFNWIVLAALGQPTGVLFALVAGMLLVVPFIGGFVALIPPAMLVYLDSPQPVALRNVIILLIALAIAQQITMQVIAPRIMSTHVGLHPLLIFVALLVGALEAGVWGALFGPPVAAVVVAMVDTFFERWRATSRHYPDLSGGGSAGGPGGPGVPEPSEPAPSAAEAWIVTEQVEHIASETSVDGREQRPEETPQPPVPAQQGVA